MPSKVIIIDYGSQVTQLIARRVREAGVYSEIHPCVVTAAQVKAMQPSERGGKGRSRAGQGIP